MFSGTVARCIRTATQASHVTPTHNRPDHSPGHSQGHSQGKGPRRGEAAPDALAKPPPEDYSPAYKRFVLLMLTLVYAFNFIDRQILVILQEPIKADMGLSDAQLGLLSGFTFAVVYVSAGIPLAYWADRSNRRNIVAAALAIWSGMTALSGLAQNYTHLLLARLGVGLGEAGGSPPAHAMISDYYPPRQRATALSFYAAGVYLGVLVGFALGGILADAFGWRAAFMAVGLPGVLFALLLWLTVREPRRGRWDAGQAVAAAPSLGRILSLLRGRRAFWYLALGCAFTAFSSYGNGNFWPSLLIRNHGMSVAEVGLVLSLVFGISGAIGTFSGGFLVDRLSGKDRRWYAWVPLLGVTLAAGPYYFANLENNTGVALFVLFVGGIFKSFHIGPCIAASHAMVPPRMRALTSAVLFFVLNMIGLGLGPLFTGLMSDLLAPLSGADNLRHAMCATTTLGLLAVPMFWQASRHLPSSLSASAADTQDSGRG